MAAATANIQFPSVSVLRSNFEGFPRPAINNDGGNAKDIAEDEAPKEPQAPQAAQNHPLTARKDHAATLMDSSVCKTPGDEDVNWIAYPAKAICHCAASGTDGVGKSGDVKNEMENEGNASVGGEVLEGEHIPLEELPKKPFVLPARYRPRDRVKSPREVLEILVNAEFPSEADVEEVVVPGGGEVLRRDFGFAGGGGVVGVRQMEKVFCGEPRRVRGGRWRG